VVQDLDIARWRLHSQDLVWSYAVSAREAVGSLLAVQAECRGRSREAGCCAEGTR
jgi:hypothetical protein